MRNYTESPRTNQQQTDAGEKERAGENDQLLGREAEWQGEQRRKTKAKSEKKWY